MRVRIVDNSSGSEQVVHVAGCEMLIGSDDICDIVLPDRPGFEIRVMHARLAFVGHHIYLRTAHDADGWIEPFYNSDPESNISWQDKDKRVDENGFQIGEFTIAGIRFWDPADESTLSYPERVVQNVRYEAE